LTFALSNSFPFSFYLEYCRKPHPLGLSYQLKDIPDESITVSSARVPSKHARLWDDSELSWCGFKLPNQWIRVDLGQVASISGVATQGSKYGKVTEYKIRYSYDGQLWYGYPNNASLKVSLRFVFIYLCYHLMIR
jgi:hypothetical protein